MTGKVKQKTTFLFGHSKRPDHTVMSYDSLCLKLRQRTMVIPTAPQRRPNQHVIVHLYIYAVLSDAIHMAREQWQNAIQYLYLHIFTTKFVAILLTLTQKCHISQISKVQKVRHLEQPSDRWRTKQSAVWSSANNTNKRLTFFKFGYRKYSNIFLLYKSTNLLLLKWT